LIEAGEVQGGEQGARLNGRKGVGEDVRYGEGDLRGGDVCSVGIGPKTLEEWGDGNMGDGGVGGWVGHPQGVLKYFGAMLLVLGITLRCQYSHH
jgi:hypothetical protein